MNLPFQGEIVDINERAQQIKAAQQAAQTEAEQAQRAEAQQAQQQRQESIHHTQEVRELLNRFLVWARRHHVPQDVVGHWTKITRPILPYSTGTRNKKLKGWCIASHPDTYTADGDQHPTTRYYTISRNGSVYTTTHTPRSRYFESTEDLEHLTTGMIEEYIAGFVAKHNIPWDE